MSRRKDWRDNYAEVECWVWANFRHKIVVKVPENSTAQDEALKVLKSEPVEFWCDPHSEDWYNFPDINERYEVGNDLEILEAFCEGTTEQDIIECCWNIDEKEKKKLLKSL
ncbi:MAG: hypothetical protein VXU43_03030 [Pseudomonadota bacterium]|nr:hypothetical protein [Pseudomonadota bacterium]